MNVIPTTDSQPNEARRDTPAPMQGGRDTHVRAAELIISGVLRGGVLVSAALIAVGAALFYARGATERIVAPHDVGTVLHGALTGDALAIISLGLLILLLTPTLRVLVSILAFAVERDWRFTLITLIVLGILLTSVFIGAKGG